MTNKRQPIIEFTSAKQARACLREWQSRLFLADWIIDIQIGVEIPADEDGDGLGRIDVDYNRRCALITLVAIPETVGSRIFRVSQEQTLVHELLHCKIGAIQADGSMEGQYYNAQQHALIEELSRSLVMAKYGVSAAWFNNLGWKGEGK
jgi:hypothetical protein